MTKVVARETGVVQLLHQVTVDPDTKLVPLTVIVMEFAVPAVVLEGEMEVTPAGLMENERVLDPD